MIGDVFIVSCSIFVIYIMVKTVWLVKTIDRFMKLTFQYQTHIILEKDQRTFIDREEESSVWLIDNPYKTENIVINSVVKDSITGELLYNSHKKALSTENHIVIFFKEPYVGSAIIYLDHIEMIFSKALINEYYDQNLRKHRWYWNFRHFIEDKELYDKIIAFKKENIS